VNAGDGESDLAGRGSRRVQYAARKIVPFPLVDWGMSPPSTPAMPFDNPSYLPRGHSPPPSSSFSLLVEPHDLACQFSSLMHWITYLPSEFGVCATFVIKVDCISYEGD